MPLLELHSLIHSIFIQYLRTLGLQYSILFKTLAPFSARCPMQFRVSLSCSSGMFGSHEKIQRENKNKIYILLFRDSSLCINFYFLMHTFTDISWNRRSLLSNYLQNWAIIPQALPREYMISLQKFHQKFAG